MKTKFWDGQTDHPFFARLSERINHLGFVWVGAEFDKETGVARWRMPLFDGYALELSLMADNARLASGCFGFQATLFVVSERQGQVWNDYRLWDCFNLVPGNMVVPERGPARILVIGLRWLIRAWHEPKGTQWPVPGWSNVPNEDAAVCADGLGRFLDMHMPTLVPLLASPDALAHTMLNLETFPGKFDANGPGSACRSVYTAVLLHHAGRTDEAMKELDLQERQVSARVHSGLDAEFLEVARCQTARLKYWMSGGMPLPSTATPEHRPG